MQGFKPRTETNKGELRQFSLHSNIYNSKNKYLELFNSIITNDTSLRPYDNNYSQQKRYLYNAILESLIFKNKKNNPESQVLFFINCSDFLFQKQLPSQAYSLIKKALTITKKNELFSYHIRLIEKEKEIRLFINNPKERSFDEINKEEEVVIAKQQDLKTSADLLNRLLHYKKKYGYLNELQISKITKEVKKIRRNSSESDCLSERSRYYYHFAMSVFYWMQMKHQEGYYHSEKLIFFNKDILSSLEYLNGLLDYTTSCICLGRFDDLLTILKRVQKEYKQGNFGDYNSTALKIFYYRSNYELMSHVFLGNKIEVQLKIKEINIGLRKWSDNTTFEMRIVISSSLKLAYLALHKFKEAKKEIDFIINEKNNGIRLDAYEDSLMYNLIVLFELNSIDDLEKYAKENIAYFTGKPNTIDTAISIKISTIFYEFCLSQISDLQLFNQFKEIIDTRINKLSISFSELYHPYLIWVKSKVEQTSFLKMAKQF